MHLQQIPLLAALTSLLKKDNQTDQTTKSTLLEAVQGHFCQADTEYLFRVATMLDPR